LRRGQAVRRFTAAQTYLTDLLTRLVNGWPQKRIDELMPWHWAPQSQA
jgi:transposase